MNRVTAVFLLEMLCLNAHAWIPIPVFFNGNLIQTFAPVNNDELLVANFLSAIPIFYQSESGENGFTYFFINSSNQVYHNSYLSISNIPNSGINIEASFIPFKSPYILSPNLFIKEAGLQFMALP